MFHQWRIVFRRSYGAVLVHAAYGEDDATAIPEDGWSFCDDVGECKNNQTLRVAGMFTLY